MKKIPYGISNYKELIEGDYYYIDKTMYLPILESTADTVMCHRPSGFGKTLITSVMYYYYDGYADIVILKNDLCKANIIIELKYIKKKDYIKELLE